MKKNRIYLCLFLSMLMIKSFSQEAAPSLSIGLDNLIFSKGAIDIELLSEIITAKQDELKKEFIKRNILKNINANNFTYYNYANNTLDILLREKNKKIATREIMEYTVNFALVYGIAELYVELNNPNEKLGNDGNMPSEKSNNSKTNKTKPNTPTPLKAILSSFNCDNINAEEGKIFKLSKLRNCNVEIEVNGKKTKYYLTNIIIDLIYDICKNDYHIQNQGFFLQATNASDIDYETTNAYLKYKKDIASDSKKSEALENFRKDIITKITPFFAHYEIFKESNFLRGTRFAKFIEDYEKLVQDKFGYQSKNKTLEDAENEVTELKNRKATLENKQIVKAYDKKKLIKGLQDLISELNQVPGIIQALKALENSNVEYEKYGRSPSDILATIIDSIPSEDEITIYDVVEYNAMNTGLRRLFQQNNGTFNDEQINIINAAANKLVPILITATEYYETIDRLSYLAQEIKSQSEYLHSLKNALDDFNLKNTTLIINKAIKDISNTLLEKGINTYGDTTGTVSKIYKVIKVLENPNQSQQTISLANYILDSLNTQIIKNLYAANGYRPRLPNYDDEILVAEESNHLSFVLQQLEIIAYQIKLDKFKNFDGVIRDLNGFEKALNNPNNFIDFITQLNQLDKSSTYDFLLKSLVDAGSVFSDTETGVRFNYLINNIKKYIITDDKNNSIDIDIEGLIITLYDKYANQKYSPFGLYFGIGLNTSFQIKNSLPLDGEKISSLGFASEKIGIKLKVKDFKRKSSLSNAISEPLVTDWYALAYGSGLLYNITNLKSEKNFDSTIIGLGTGISFYNFLDFNISIAYPQINLEDYSNSSLRFFNVGFDIKITEYLGQIAKKRKEQKAMQSKK